MIAAGKRKHWMGPIGFSVAAGLSIVAWLTSPIVAQGTASSGSQKSGKALYLAACSNCHGADGRASRNSRWDSKHPFPISPIAASRRASPRVIG
jgi:mono/diheme cytochrome c family protein